MQKSNFESLLSLFQFFSLQLKEFSTNKSIKLSKIFSITWITFIFPTRYHSSPLLWPPLSEFPYRQREDSFYTYVKLYVMYYIKLIWNSIISSKLFNKIIIQVKPPPSLLEYLPLAVLANGCQTAFTNLRLCCPLALGPKVKDRLTLMGTKVVDRVTQEIFENRPFQNF